MKKKIIFLLLTTLLCCTSNMSFCQNEGSISCDQLPQKTTPAMAVNDFANIIDDAAQQTMEREIRTYWDSTSIALVVLTVQNMNGNEVSEYALSLFRCWGIGGAGSNRGILFMISMDERKLWIATGYGIEGILSDVTCHEITEQYVKPIAKEGKYSEAMVAGVNQIFKTLGTMSWEERMEGIEAEKAAKDKKWADFKEVSTNVILGIVLLVLLIILVRVIAKSAERKKLRAQMSALILKMTKETLTAGEKIKIALKGYEKQAKWARDEAESHEFEANDMLSKARIAITDAENCYKEDLEKAQKLLQRAEQMIEKSFNNFVKIDQGLWQKIKTFSSDAPVRLISAKKQIASALNALNECAANGYRFPHAVSKQQDYQKLIEDYEGKIKDPGYHQLIYTQSEIIRTQSGEAIEKILAIVQKQIEVANNIAGLIALGKKQYEYAKKHIAMFDQYKAQYPGSVWREQEILLNKLIAKLDSQRLDKLAVDINDANSMERQDFTAAAMKYDELKDQIDQTKVVCRAVADIGIDQEKNKGLYLGKCKSAEQLVAKALQKIKDSDVSSSTKSKAKAAQQELEKARIQSSQSILDWVLLIMLLNSISDSANAAIRAAENDIRDAENEREEEARRVRNRRNSGSSYGSSSYGNSSYGSSYSSYSSSSDSSSSFGGFDGGSSGGGGGGSDF